MHHWARYEGGLNRVPRQNFPRPRPEEGPEPWPELLSVAWRGAIGRGKVTNNSDSAHSAHTRETTADTTPTRSMITDMLAEFVPQQ